MSFKQLKEDFDKLQSVDLIPGINIDSAESKKSAYSEATFRHWLLRLLFEIAGNLDSLAVAYREMAKLAKERQK